MQTTLAELAALVDGHLVGDGELIIRGAASLRDAQTGEITLVDGCEKQRLLTACRATAVIAPRDYTPEGVSAVLVDDVHRAFAAVILHFHPPRQQRRIGRASCRERV